MKKKIINFIICNFLIILIFLVLTFIDFDLRYRLYLYPFFIMLSIYCLNKIYEKKDKIFLGKNYIFIFGLPGSGTTIISKQISKNIDSSLWLEPYFIWREK